MPNPAFEAGTETMAVGMTDASTSPPGTGSTATTPPTTGEATTTLDPGTTTLGATTEPGGSTTEPGGSTTEPGGSTAGPGSSSTGANVKCGDGVVEGDEVCDAGPEPPLEPGACLPTCDGTIGEKLIFAAPTVTAGDFAAGLDLSAADETCTSTAEELGFQGAFKALISDFTARWASTAPYLGDCSEDWPVQPYTAYVNLDAALVWVTGDIRLLGVVHAPPPDEETHQPVPLHSPIDPMATFVVWTGLANTWETASTCEDWQGGTSGTAGKPAKDLDFLSAAGNLPCTEELGLICVEQ